MRHLRHYHSISLGSQTKNEAENNIQIVDEKNNIFKTDEEILEHFNKIFIDKVKKVKKEHDTPQNNKIQNNDERYSMKTVPETVILKTN